MSSCRTRAVLALAAIVAIGACTPVGSGSTVTTPPSRPGAPALPVTGRLLAADGRPLAAAALRLDENRGIASDIFGAVAFLFTFGLSCVGGADPCRPSGGVGATTRSDGAFGFDATAVERARGRSNGVILSAGSESSGALRVKLNPTVGGDLGDVAVWAPMVQAQTDRLDVRFTAMAPPGADRRTEVSAGIVDARKRLVGQTTRTGARAAFVVDRRTYEDGPGIVVLTAGFSRPRAGQSPRIDWTSAPVRVGPGAGPPRSRGRPCTMDLGGLPAPPGCPLTDGDLVTDAVGGLRSAVVDLGAPQGLGLVAVRPAAGSAEISTDGQVWALLLRSPARDGWPATLFDAGGRPARFVRVASPDRSAPPGRPAPPGSTSPATTEFRSSGGFTEISVWPADAQPPPVPSAAPPALPAAPAGTSAAPSATADEAIPQAEPLAGLAGGRVAIPAAVALVLLLAVAACAGSLATRRRR